jgi:hypothetical protein
LRSEPDSSIARAVAVVGTALDDFEEEALDEGAGIQVVIAAAASSSYRMLNSAMRASTASSRP